jgi:hypothetical protein
MARAGFQSTLSEPTIMNVSGLAQRCHIWPVLNGQNTNISKSMFVIIITTLWGLWKWGGGQM